MESLNLPGVDYDDVSEKRNSLSYVIINPSCDLKLEEGDIIYLVRPSPFSAQKTFERHNSRRKSNISFCSNMAAAACAAAAAAAGGSRRGSGLGLNNLPSTMGYGSPRAHPPPLPHPPLQSKTKSNSLSLPDSPTVVGQQRGRSNSLRVSVLSSSYRSLSILNPTNSLFRITDRQRHPPEALQFIAAGSAEYRPVHGQAKVLAGGDWHQPLHNAHAGDEPQQSDKDRPER